MSKYTYYEMCEQLGTNPDDGEIPIDYDDLMGQTQQALNLFQYLPDKWDSMGGGYLGKDLSSIKFYLELLDISDWTTIIDILNFITNYRIESVNTKLQSKNKRKS